MKILGEIVEMSDDVLYIPWFHRVAPSLQSHTWVHGVVLPGPPAEIYLSPYPSRSWNDLWRLECEFIDRPGLFSELTELLGDKSVNANILAHESSTLRHEDLFNVTLICDMSGYGDRSNPDGTWLSRAEQTHPSLGFLCDYITVEMFRDVVFRRGRPQVFASRLRDLHRIGLLMKIANLPAFESEIVGGRLQVGRGWELFKKEARLTEAGGLWVTITSDTEERYVRLMAFPRGRDAILLSVVHTDTSGQIARFSNLISKELGERVNIHCSYLRLQKADGFAEWRCLLDMDAGSGKRIKEELRDLFSDSNVSHWRDDLLSVSFPPAIDASTEPWIHYEQSENNEEGA